MNLKFLTDIQIMIHLGKRIKRKRINLNFSQLEVAEKAGISRRTVQAIEAGQSISLVKLIAILRSIDSLDSLDLFLPPVEISPLLMAKMEGRERKRSYKRNREVKRDGVSW